MTKRTDDQRRSLRRILMLALVPIALAALVLAGKFASVNFFASNEQSAFQRRAYAEAAQHARGLEWWNFFETWKAPYNLGVALGMRGELDEARALLEDALERNAEPTSNEYCVILTSLVYVVEKQGDAARDADGTQAANGRYREALALIEEAPEGCLEPPAAGEANTQAQLEAATPRIEEKIEDSSSDSGGGDGAPQEPQGEQPQTPQDILEQQNQQAQEQQQAQDDYYQEQQGAGGEGGEGGGVDRPW